MSSLTFLGAARTVTGSKYLLEAGGRRVLFDAGLFQGLKHLRERNWQELPVEPASLDAVVLTHAHLDHSGYLPRLVRDGFRGHIFCTAGTAELCRLVLPDAARLQEKDARGANLEGCTRHRPALPMFREIIHSMSAHADRREILRWLGGFERSPRLTCLVHGEPAAMEALAAHVSERLGWQVTSPDYLDRIEVAGP